MYDNILSTAVFALISAVALAAAAQIVDTEVKLDKASAVAHADPVRLPTVVVTSYRLPTVVVNGHRTPSTEAVAGGSAGAGDAATS